MLAKLENSPVATRLEHSVFISITKKGNAKECSNYCTIALISHARKVMLKILQARFQQYMNQEIPDVQASFRKSRGTRDQIANIHWIIEKAREFQKKPTFVLLTTPKPLTVWITTNYVKFLKNGNTRPHYLPPEISACRSRSNSENWTWNNRLVQNGERSKSRPHCVTLPI